MLDYALHNQLDDGFKEIGGFGKHQFLVLILFGLMASQTAILDSGYELLSATPQYR
jgi:hypothetical protein